MLRVNDLLARPTSALFWWGFPFLAAVSTNVLPLSQSAEAAVWAVALAWMGVGCTLNALRCHRLHCYISAPLLFLGAAVVAAAGFGYEPLGPSTCSLAVNVSLALVLLSFLAEPVWGRYRSR
jgi:hypothetical protein